jgi:mannan endo-1,4-beta-mannosidase
MKSLKLLLVLILITGYVSGQKLLFPSDKNATKETVALFRSLFELKNKGVIYGHQDDLMYGFTWWYEKDRSDTKDFTGDYPGVAGFELGHLEHGVDRSLDSVSFSQMTDQIKAHYRRGGVVTLSWHPDNPMTMKEKDTPSHGRNGTAWDVSSKEVVASILPGGKNNELFNTWLERLSQFFSGLTDDSGKPIPVIFRPYHEHSGSFFWWGTNICTNEQYIALWRYTVDFLCNKKNIHNILYAYNTDRVTSLEQYMTGYPGDNIIDMLSLDMYDRGPVFGGELDKALEFVTAEAVKRNKLTALSETGELGKAATDWWSTVLMPVVSKYPVGYALTWRNTYMPKKIKNADTFKPYPDDFMNFYNSPRSLFLKEVQEADVYRRR